MTHLSIVTATYNCAHLLPGLIASLRRQSDKNFEWIVADGASTEGTLELVRAITDFPVVVSSQPDFGIYDALNRGLMRASGEYYVVAGADDAFADDAVARYRAAIQERSAEIVAARVMYGKHCFRIKKGPTWLVGEKAFIANHSLGTVIKKSLHERFGFYSRKLPLAADALFLLRACKGGATRHELEFVAGKMGMHGASATDWAGSATEVFRMQLMLGGSVGVQAALLLLRILKGSSSQARALHDALLR